MTWIWVMLGGALGSGLRYAISLAIAHHPLVGFPWSTLVVNSVGSFLIGVGFVLLGPDGRFAASPEIRNFLIVGLLGGFTTYSTFSLQTVILIQNHAWIRAGSNIILTLFLCLASCWLGLLLGKAFLIRS